MQDTTQSEATPADIVARYADTEGPAQGLVHAQRYNRMTSEALAAYLSSATPPTSPADCDEAVGSDLAVDWMAAWAKATDNLVYDTIVMRQSRARDDDGNQVDRQVPEPHRINVSVRLDKFASDILADTVMRLKKGLRARPVDWPEHRPDPVKFLKTCARLFPNVEDPASAATAWRQAGENIMANRGVDGARKQQTMVYQYQPVAGGGGKNLVESGFESYGHGMGLLFASYNPAETHFVSDNAGYADVLYCAECPRIPKEAYAGINNVVDNVQYLAERKHRDPQEVTSVATCIINSNYDYPDANNRRVGLVTYAANRIYNLTPDEEQYFSAYAPKRCNQYSVKFQVEGNSTLEGLWHDFWESIPFGAVFEDTSAAGDSVVIDHSYLRALQIMQQVVDANDGSGKYAGKYDSALSCRPKTDYRDLDHCVQCLVRAGIVATAEKREARALIGQLVLEASRRGVIPGKGRKADRIPFTAYDFCRCTVDAPDADEGYTYAAIRARWDRLIAAYTTGPDNGGHDNVRKLPGGNRGDAEGHHGDPEGAPVEDLQGEVPVAAPAAAVAPRDIDSQLHLPQETAGASLDTVGRNEVESDFTPTCGPCATPSPTPLTTEVAEQHGHLLPERDTAMHQPTVAGPQAGASLPDNMIGTTVTTVDGQTVVLDGADCTWMPPDTLCCHSKYSTGADCLPIEEWESDPLHGRPEYLVAATNRPGHVGRRVEDVYPTYIVYEADHISGEEQLANINWDKARGHIASITDSMRASKHILVPLGEAGKRILDNDTMALVAQAVGKMLFHDPSVLDPATWTVNRLTRCPGGTRTRKDDDDNGPWVGQRHRQLYVNAEATPPDGLDGIVSSAILATMQADVRKSLNRMRYDRRTDGIDVPALLQEAGWIYLGKSGDNEQWQRPGKSGDGLSAHWDGKCFYPFTSSTEFEAGRGYSALSVLALLKFDGDVAAARRSLDRKEVA